MKLLGIDYGQKKVGLSLSSGTIAMPWKILKNFNSNLDLIIQIKEIVEIENIEKIIVGWPVNLKNKSTTQTELVNKFIKLLKQNFNIPIIFEDERFTSSMTKHQEVFGDDDAQAAANILQIYLDKIFK